MKQTTKEKIYVGIIILLIVACAQVYYSFRYKPVAERGSQVYYNQDRELNREIINLIKDADQFVYFAVYTFTRFGIKDAKKRDEFLRKTNQEFLAVFIADPVLPPELLPADWPAAKCRKFLLQAGAVKE